MKKKNELSLAELLEEENKEDIDNIFDEDEDDIVEEVEAKDDKVIDIVIDLEKEEAESVAQQSVTIPFNDVSHVEIEEKDHSGNHIQTYVYDRIKDPSGKDHPRFTGFCLEKTSEGDIWHSLNGLLSSRYTAVSITKVLENFVGKLPIVGNPEYIKRPFGIMVKMNLDTDVVYFDNKECKYILSLVSGVSIDDLKSYKSSANLMISNSYDGSASVSVTTPIRTISEHSGSVYDFTDYFTMVDKGSSMNHIIYNTENINAELGNIQERVQSYKTKLESVVDITKHVENISKKLLKTDHRRRFLSLCENLDGEFKNLFYVFMMVSIILSKEFDMNSYSAVSNYMSTVNKND